jgi:hypothetical protein
MKGFKSLGFTLMYKGNDIEDGIESYEKGFFDRKSVKDYGSCTSQPVCILVDDILTHICALIYSFICALVYLCT